MTATRAPWIGLDLENGRYHVLGLLGEGGMASIFKATDRQSNKEVVLKVPKPALLADPEFQHRFAREIRTLVELKHPSVVAVFGFGRHDNVPFAVLEYLSGRTLAEQPKRCQPKDLGTWLPDIAAALDHIHKAGYVHRDVKPGNILFDAKGRPRLADFGIIKSINEKANQQTMALTESGVTVGTPEYMAPELAKGHSFDGKVDQYALAVTVYERLSGRRPIEGGTGPVILVKQIREKPKPLDEVAEVSIALSEVVGKALSKNPKDRYPSCFEFARAVMNPSRPTPAATKVPANTVVSGRTPLAYEAQPQRSSWVLPAAIGGGALALALMALLGWILLRPNQVPGAANQAPKIILTDVPSHVVNAGDKAFTFKPVENVKAIVGKVNKFSVAVERTPRWPGAIPLFLMADQNGAVQVGSATIEPDKDSATVSFRFAAGVTSASIKVIGKAGEFAQELAVPLEIVVPRFTVAKLNDVHLKAGEDAVVEVSITRDNFDDEVVLVAEGSGIISGLPMMRFPAGVNEASLRLRPLGNAQSVSVRLLDVGSREVKASFNVTVEAASKAKSKTPAPRTVDATLVGRLTSDVAILVFSPRDGSTLAAWDNTSVQIWDTAAKKSKAAAIVAGRPVAGTFSPDGQKLLTATESKAYLHNTKGDELNSGKNLHKVIGVYFDTVQTTMVPYFWSTAGLCGMDGKLRSAGTGGANSIKYSTFGAAHKLSETGDKLKYVGKKNVTMSPGRIGDYGASHDGRWVIVASGDKILLYDIENGDGASAIWEKEVNGVKAVAVAPDGRTVAVGVGRELRILQVDSKQ